MEVIIPLVMALLIDKGIDGQGYGRHLEIRHHPCAVRHARADVRRGGRHLCGEPQPALPAICVTICTTMCRISFSNIDKFSTGSIVTRLTTDVTNVQNAFQMCTRIAVRCPVMLVFALFMAMRINSRMALVFLAVLPILAIGMGILMKVVGPVFERAFKIYDRMNTVVQENVRGIRVVKTYVREDHETEKFEGVSGMLYRTFSKAQKTMAGVMPLMQFCMYACMLLISWFGARLIVGGSMTTGELTSMFSYAMQILMSLMMVAMVFVMITMAKASAERVAEILDEQSDLHNPANPIHEVKDGAIEFDDVSFSYKGDERKLALKKRQPAYYQGRSDRRHSRRHRFREVYARAADSARCAIPRTARSRSAAWMFAITISRSCAIRLPWCSRRTCCSPARSRKIFAGGDENASDEELERVCRLAQADEFIQQMPDKYDTHIEQGGSNVSGGQKQRLCIARALLKKPKILILDDSTSAVDTKTDALIRKAFAEEIPDTTKIIIAQRVSSVQDADQIVILDGGTVQAVGTHDELLAANTIYQEIYNQQNRKGGEE